MREGGYKKRFDLLVDDYAKSNKMNSVPFPSASIFSSSSALIAAPSLARKVSPFNSRDHLQTVGPKTSVAAGANSFLFACIWWPVGLALATFYFVFISRRYAGKVSARRDSQGFY